MTWFGGFQCYYSSRTCGLTCEAWGWGRSSRSCYESWCETTVVRAWSKREIYLEGGIGKRRRWIAWVTERREWWGLGGWGHTGPTWVVHRCHFNISFPLISLCQSLVLPSHLAIVVLEVLEFWQLCLECCNSSLEGRVCMSNCVCLIVIVDADTLVCSFLVHKYWCVCVCVCLYISRG